MGLRDKLRRLEKTAEGELESFELLDGSRYYYDRLEAAKALFMHLYECGTRSAYDWPELPEVVRKLTEAKGVKWALELVEGEGKFSFLVYNPDILITERRLEPRPLVSRYDPEASKHVPIDPYEDDALEDLSEWRNGG